MGKADHFNYGVVLDAGSSGTRAYVYRWMKHDEARQKAAAPELKSLPVLETKDKWTKKVHPGVSTFGEKPEQIGPDHLNDLIEHALKYVPKKAVKDTPIFVLATAGMRLLPEYQSTKLLEQMCSYIKSETEFLLPDCDQHIQIIPGDTEGLYGWIAANYLLGAFDSPETHEHGNGHHTYGFLDMGGASAQIAFAPNAIEAKKHANDLKLVRFRNIDGSSQEYKVFITTWLKFGVNEARKRYVTDLLKSVAIDSNSEVPDPCLPTGVLLSTDGTLLTGSPSGQYLIGTGKFDECLKRSFPLLGKDKECLDEPCLINGVHVPAIDFDVNHFIGISEYWHTTHEIFEMGQKDKAYDFNTYQKRVKEFCEQEWSEIEKGVKDHTWGKKVDQQTAYEVCFKASWLINVLHDGIGIPRVGIEGTSGTHNGTKEVIEAGKEKGFLAPFQAANEIHDKEISWTMGKMLLYASADVPSAESETTPVGFGSNEEGVNIPTDFQYPGGAKIPGTENQSITGKISSSLFKSDASHRLPGFLFFLLIMVIAIFYMCGRDRRSRIYTTYFQPRHSGKQSQIGNLLQRFVSRKRNSAEYDRSLEDGSATRLYDPSEFELGDMNDSDEEWTNAPKSSSGGRSSPYLTRSNPAHTTTGKVPPSMTHAPHLSGSSSGGRMSPDAMLDRQGYVVRTASREKLGDIGGRKSRSASMSPTRLRNG